MNKYLREKKILLIFFLPEKKLWFYFVCFFKNYVTENSDLCYGFFPTTKRNPKKNITSLEKNHSQKKVFFKKSNLFFIFLFLKEKKNVSCHVKGPQWSVSCQ